MCGIVGAIAQRNIVPILTEGLKRLEYRGYDSAGVCTVQDGQLIRRRAEGKLNNLVKELAGNPAPGLIGIAHTRWATHGVPCERNAHPHVSGSIAVVHNGIIENYLEPYLNYYVVPNADEAVKAIALLGQSQKGRANFGYQLLVGSALSRDHNIEAAIKTMLSPTPMDQLMKDAGAMSFFGRAGF